MKRCSLLIAAACLAVCAPAGSAGYTSNSDQVDFLPVSVTQYAGYAQVNTTSNLFYWFFESQTAPATAPLMIWLNGGPGASSLFGCFAELGPVKLNSSGLPEPNPESWNKNMNLLFWDQPVVLSDRILGYDQQNTRAILTYISN